MATPQQPTNQQPIVATTTSSSPLAENRVRRFLYVRCYAVNPTNGTVGQPTMWLSFGNPATPGMKGEMEIQAGTEYTFGGRLEPPRQTLPGSFFLPNCPTESVNVITASGSAYGCVIEF
jgi:hypothetical protein